MTPSTPSTPSTTLVPATVTVLDGTGFDEAIATATEPVLVDFTATWCPPCKQLSPVLHALAPEQAGRFAIAEVDIDRSPELATRYGIQGAPTMLLFQDGQVVERLVGARGRARLLEELAPHLP